MVERSRKRSRILATVPEADELEVLHEDDPGWLVPVVCVSTASGLSHTIVRVAREFERPGSSPTTWDHTLSQVYWESSYYKMTPTIDVKDMLFETPISEDVD